MLFELCYEIKPHVFLELGYALGRDKLCILLVRTPFISTARRARSSSRAFWFTPTSRGPSADHGQAHARVRYSTQEGFGLAYEWSW